MSDEERDQLESWQPAFEGQRPPFQPGHELAVRHGARSERRIAERLPEAVREVLEAIADDTPYIKRPDLFLVERLARLLTRARLIDEWLDHQDGSLIDAKGRPKGPAELSLRLEHQIREHCRTLGLSPTARAELMASVEGSRERRWRDAQARVLARIRGEDGDGAA